MSGSRRTIHRSEHLFVVRMWQEPAGAETPETPATPSTNRSDWRGTVQHILSGERVYFVQFPDLNAFIRSQLARPAPKGDAPQIDPATRVE